MTRLAEHAPPLCSACYGQYVDRRHVDFESSWDGPVVEGGVMGDDGVVLSRIPVSIDELVICEDCLRFAARLIGMEDGAGMVLAGLQEQNQVLREQVTGLEAYVDQMEKALTSKPQRKKVSA